MAVPSGEDGVIIFQSRRNDTSCLVPSLRDLRLPVSSLSAGCAIASPTVNKVLSHAGHLIIDMTVGFN